MRFREELGIFVKAHGGIASTATDGHVNSSYLSHIVNGDPRNKSIRYETLAGILDGNNATELEECKVMWAAGYVPPMFAKLEITSLVINILKVIDATQTGRQPIV